MKYKLLSLTRVDKVGRGGRTPHAHPYTHIDRVPAPMWVKTFLINVIKIWSSYLCLKQERIQEFQNQGLEFFGSGNCFDASSHIPNVSVVRVGNNIHIVSIACWLHYSVCVLGSQNLPKQTQQIFQTGWRAPGAPVLVPPLWNQNLYYFISYFLCIFYGLRRVHLKILINPTMLVNSCTYI